MNPDFQPNYPTSDKTKFVDPEAYDASEQQFAASLEAAAPESAMVEEASQDSVQADNEASSAWRKEIAERVNKYRRKSPREPRYPSLQLKFETWEPMRTPEPPPTTRQSVALESETQFVPEPLPAYVEPAPARPHEEAASNLIEFPRFTAEPVRQHNELAEPVLDQLRILEAPEIAPAPPALGGIHIEQVEEQPQERRPGFEIPLQSASIARRVAAAVVDGMIILTSVALFGYVFFRLSAPVLPRMQWISVGACLSCLFWSAYQYLFLVHTGSTPGLRIAKLRLARFDGAVVPRALRRWRVLTSILSVASLCLGYLWCFLDEDQLSWHDRITRTHLSPKKFSS